ncbi:MAG: hypothetical protein ACRCYV_03555 [Aeromonas sp.]
MQTLLIGAAPLRAVEIEQFLANWQAGELEVESFAPFAVSLAEISLLCLPQARAQVWVRDAVALRRALLSAHQIAQLRGRAQFIALHRQAAPTQPVAPSVAAESAADGVLAANDSATAAADAVVVTSSKAKRKK